MSQNHPLLKFEPLIWGLFGLGLPLQMVDFSYLDLKIITIISA